jgi:hypothetical protein
MNDEETCGIVADGRERLIDVLQPRIEAEVRARRAAELESAGPLERLRLEVEIAAEIRRTVNRQAPPEALY